MNFIKWYFVNGTIDIWSQYAGDNINRDYMLFFLTCIQYEFEWPFSAHSWLLESMSSHFPILLIGVLNFLLTHLQMKEDQINWKQQLRLSKNQFYIVLIWWWWWAAQNERGPLLYVHWIDLWAVLRVQRISRKKGPASRKETWSQSYTTASNIKKAKIVSNVTNLDNFTFKWSLLY